MNRKKILIWIGILFLVIVLLGVVKNIRNNSSEEINIIGCGNGLCEDDETKSSCPNDCDEITCRELYQITEDGCIENGWGKLYIDVDGIERELLWKASEVWENGAIIVMHGGEGVDSNFCYAVPKEQKRFLSDILRGVPVAEFGELAVEEGFAVFSLNSAFNRATDSEGRSIGKRWDSLMQEGKENIDLQFIEKLIDETIPSLRPSNSKNDIFMTGISNGGFMTTFTATHFNNKITAFAPVSSGDPYGTYFNMSEKGPRLCGPGTWRDLETNIGVQELDSCKSDSYPNELEWPEIKRSIPFKQFYHEGDGGIHISCMKKTNELLIDKGYQDTGAFIIDNPDNKRTVEKHFWQEEYNQLMLDFFKKNLTD